MTLSRKTCLKRTEQYFFGEVSKKYKEPVCIRYIRMSFMWIDSKSVMKITGSVLMAVASCGSLFCLKRKERFNEK